MRIEIMFADSPAMSFVFVKMIKIQMQISWVGWLTEIMCAGQSQWEVLRGATGESLSTGLFSLNLI